MSVQMKHADILIWCTRKFNLCLKIPQESSDVFEQKDSDQTAQMCRLILVFAVHKCIKHCCAYKGSIVGIFKMSGNLEQITIVLTSLSGFCLNKRQQICSNNGTAISQLIATSRFSAVRIHCHFCCWEVLSSSDK